MKKAPRIAALASLALLLTGCMDAVRELYPERPFDSPEFDENYYAYWESAFVPGEGSKVAGTNIHNPAFTDETPHGKDFPGLDAEDHTFRSGEETVQLDWLPDTPIQDYGVGFGPTKNLYTIDRSFGNGVLSKLYDGRVRCDGKYQLSRVQIDREGYGAYFPKRLKKAHLFALALRGATTLEETRRKTRTSGPWGAGHPLGVDLTVSFYKYDGARDDYQEERYVMENVQVPTDSGGETTLLSFYFNEADHQDSESPINGATGMSITFSLVPDAGLPTLSDDRNSSREEHEHFALMLYEVMLPGSEWY